MGGADDAIKAVKSGQALDALLDMGRGAKQQVTNAAANMGASASEAVAAGNIAAKETMQSAMGGVTAGANRVGAAIDNVTPQIQQEFLRGSQNPMLNETGRSVMNTMGEGIGGLGRAGRMVTDAVAAHPKRAMGAAALTGLAGLGAGGAVMLNNQGSPIPPIIMEEDY